MMLSKVLVTIGITIYGVLTPALEVGTHVFSPDYAPHARFHEIWQLTTNCSLALLCSWLTWAKNEVRLSSIVAIFVAAGYIVAYVVRDSYGGSAVVLPGGAEHMVLGINRGVLGFGLVVLLSVVVLATSKNGT